MYSVITWLTNFLSDSKLIRNICCAGLLDVLTKRFCLINRQYKRPIFSKWLLFFLCFKRNSDSTFSAIYGRNSLIRHALHHISIFVKKRAFLILINVVTSIENSCSEFVFFRDRKMKRTCIFAMKIILSHISLTAVINGHWPFIWKTFLSHYL